MSLCPAPFLFVGKNSISKVPLFGFIYRKTHITVDRKSLKSKYETFQKAKQALDENLSLCIFPEGGIASKQIPQLHRFKDGPFRIAIEKQVEIVPVTIPYNWQIMPDDNSYRIFPKRGEIIFHKPISTKEFTLDNVDQLKIKTKTVIEEEISHHFPISDRQLTE